MQFLELVLLIVKGFTMRIWIDKFALPLLVVITATLILGGLSNPLDLNSMNHILSILLCIVLSIFLVVLYKKFIVSKRESAPLPSDGSGGRGGGGKAEGKYSMVIGGKGGKGGSPSSGRGGDGGGGNATGEGAVVIGGDGGDAGRFDGRGGEGGDSPLKRLPPDLLKSFGLTGNEGYGQGGRGANSHEYDRCLRVLSTVSSEYLTKNPTASMISMPGVLMPPLYWVNNQLEQKGENFRVSFVDNNTDFLIHYSDKDPINQPEH